MPMNQQRIILAAISKEVSSVFDGFSSRVFFSHSLPPALGLGLFLITGCQSSKVALNPAQQQVQRELEKIDPRTDPLPPSTPIIDVHTHTFNARYLPLRGILLGKRDAFFPITT